MSDLDKQIKEIICWLSRNEIDPDDVSPEMYADHLKRVERMQLALEQLKSQKAAALGQLVEEDAIQYDDVPF